MWDTLKTGHTYGFMKCKLLRFRSNILRKLLIISTQQMEHRVHSSQ